MNNRVIPTRFAIFLVLIIAFAVSAFVLKKIDSLKESGGSDYQLAAIPKNNSEKNSCRVRAFQGEAEIKVWQAVENEEMVLKVAGEDLAKLPVDEKSNFKLIDSDSEIEKKLAASSEEKPVKISISGYFDRCEEVPLASLEYKDGIFRPYL